MLEARNSAGQFLALYGRIMYGKKFGGVEGSEFCRLLFWEKRRGSEVLYSEYGVLRYKVLRSLLNDWDRSLVSYYPGLN